MKDNPGVKTSKFEIPWHWRAWRARARWAGTRQRIEQWLLSLDPGQVSSSVSDAWPQGLILLGGSAGWMMSDAFLKRFRRVLLVDLDPLAAWLFRLNHRAALTASAPLSPFSKAMPMTSCATHWPGTRKPVCCLTISWAWTPCTPEI